MQSNTPRDVLLHCVRQVAQLSFFRIFLFYITESRERVPVVDVVALDARAIPDFG